MSSDVDAPPAPPSSRWRSDFRTLLPELTRDWEADAPASPAVVVRNDALLHELAIPGDDPESSLSVFTGHPTPEGTTPVAMAYAGHQFGNYNPRLGDGRALLLGEVLDRDGALVDVHLKGSGRTPFARGGDGRATLAPMLREYLIAEAMHAMGIPTGRALAVVTTGDQVARQNGPEPGAILTRVASSHLRIGTFEFARRLEDPTVLVRLADHAIARHHPHAATSEQPYLALLDAVLEAQASLIARWMHVGFIHGVMNTDNCTISGETIDYGPCAFLDRYDKDTVYSSIDHAGRYAYGNQPTIALWNLARLAEVLLPLFSDDDAEAISMAEASLGRFAERYRHHWVAGMSAKLGLDGIDDEGADLADALVEVMQAVGADHTATYRALAADLRGEAHWYGAIVDDLAEWRVAWHERLDRDGRPRAQVASAMDATNPAHVPRNHLVDAALVAAVDGDLAPFERLLAAVTAPFTPGTDLGNEQPAPDGFDERFRTFCGT